MYINKKGGQVRENKKKSLNSLLTMIRYTMSVPKGHSKLHEQFFDILTKAIAIQIKLIESSSSNTKDDSMPKYKKYFESKIYTFLHSIAPLSLLNSQKSSLSPMKDQVKSKGTNQNKYIPQGLIHTFNSNTVKKEDKLLKTSNSFEGSFKKTPLLFTSSRQHFSKSNFNTIFSQNKTTTTTQCKNHLSEEMKMYLKVTHPMIKTRHYSTASSSFKDLPLQGSLQSKPILKKSRAGSSSLKKTNVTFKENSK